MTADDTLNRYTIITAHLHTRPVACRNLPQEVQNLTAHALVFEHSGAALRAPSEDEIRRRARLRPQ